VETLVNLVNGLPRDFPAAIFVVLHIPAQAPSALPQILSRHGPLRAHHAVDGEAIKPGRIYVAPPDHHVLVGRGFVRLSRGPRENLHRPAVDPLFRSAALAYGPRVIGVVLTGALDDGTAGLLTVKRRGGLAIVQNPEDAFFPDMPASALHYVAVDYVLPLKQLPAKLDQLARTPVKELAALPAPRDLQREVQSDELEAFVMENDEIPGTLSAFTCPECKGPLWELRDGELLRFRCRTGHAFTSETMLAGQAQAIEEAMWAALNTLEESAIISRRLAREARERNHLRVAERFDERERNARQRAQAIRQVLLNGDETLPTETPEIEETVEATAAAGSTLSKVDLGAANGRRKRSLSSPNKPASQQAEQESEQEQEQNGAGD
jgi:two-component system chemotaxis response regulator CheB